MLAIPPRLISTLSMAVVKQNWRLSPTTAHVPTNLAIHGECDLDESDEDAYLAGIEAGKSYPYTLRVQLAHYPLQSFIELEDRI